MKVIKDVTSMVAFDNPDDELLPIVKCVCGEAFRFNYWDFPISIYADDPCECPVCGAKLFFSQAITVYQVEEV